MEKFVHFNLKSALGSFNRPYSNNNPSTFYIIPKSALAGIILGINGIKRSIAIKENLYKLMTENIDYSVVFKSPFKIKYWVEYGYNLDNVGKKRSNYNPIKFERLVDVDYDIYIKYSNQNDRVLKIMEDFIQNIKKRDFAFFPSMGNANFFADIEFCGEFESNKLSGRFKTKGICTNIVMSDEISYNTIKSDSIPIKNVSYLGFDHNSYITIYFDEECNKILSEGNYYEINGESLEFI